MKKYLLYPAIFLMLLSSCLAEDVFTIRGGITFGMTKEQVIAQETLNGHAMGRYFPDAAKPYLRGKSGDVDFYFDENGELDEVCYHWYDLSSSAQAYIQSDAWDIQAWDLEQLSSTSLDRSKQRAEEAFEVIEAVLNEKYPDITPQSAKWPVTYSGDNDLPNADFVMPYVKCVQRLIPYREGYIVIEHLLNGYPLSYDSIYTQLEEGYENLVTYEYMTAAELEYRVNRPYIAEYLNDIL